MNNTLSRLLHETEITTIHHTNCTPKGTGIYMCNFYNELTIKIIYFNSKMVLYIEIIFRCSHKTKHCFNMNNIEPHTF